MVNQTQALHKEPQKKVRGIYKVILPLVLLSGFSYLAYTYRNTITDDRYDFDGKIDEDQIKFERNTKVNYFPFDDVNTLSITKTDGTIITLIDKYNNKDVNIGSQNSSGITKVYESGTYFGDIALVKANILYEKTLEQILKEKEADAEKVF